jgi:flagella basal body P-ring formation protein FlgA
VPMTIKRKNYSARLPLAIVLIVTAFISAFFIATFSNKGSDYWVVTAPLSPGHTISSSDISLARMNLNSSAAAYLDSSTQPIGMVAKRILKAGEIVGANDLTAASDAMSTSAVPISVRSTDLATGMSIGEGVDIYWVQDLLNGEIPIDPILILGGVTLLSYDDGGKSFGSDIGLTVAVEETQVLRLLSATTQGRLVVIRSNV